MSPFNDEPGSLGTPILPGSIVTDVLGASVLVEERPSADDLPEVEARLGIRERRLLEAMPWPSRRAEWLAGRRVAKALLLAQFGIRPERIEVLPRPSGAPAVYIDDRERRDVSLSLSHTRSYVAAAVAQHALGLDVCDLVDGARLRRVAGRVLSEGEAERCDAHASFAHQAAVWSLKEAVLKLREGGVFVPGARSVRVESLLPPRVAAADVTVTLLRLPRAMMALAR